MDEMEALDYAGWHFLCSGEQVMPSGAYHAVVRFRVTPDDLAEMLILDPNLHDSHSLALIQAKELAVEWAIQHPHPDHENL